MIILSLGSNLSSKFGDRFYNLKHAIHMLEKQGIVIEKKSSFYETPSYPDQSNPKFINIVAAVNTNLSLKDLITILIFVEENLERKRNNKNDPRTCDIDIIDFNDKILSLKYKNSYFEVPHKNLATRNFVLFPLQEILPNWKHPKTKEFIGTLIQKLSAEHRKAILKIKKN